MHHEDHEQHRHGGAGAAPSRQANRRRLTVVFFLAAGFSVMEVVGGLLTSSLALLADAFHLLSDVAALGLSLFAVWMSQRPASARRTFGHSRAEILAALANGVGLAVMAIVLAIRAFGRFGSPTEVHGLGVVAFASGALVYELVSLWILSAGREDNLNVRGAWLHVMSDALGSLGAIAAGLAIWAFGWYWADPLASLLIGALVLHAAWWLIRDAVDVLMEAAPAHLDVEHIRSTLTALPAVRSVHDLHVWTIGSGEVSLSIHVVTGPEAGGTDALRRIRELLRERFDVLHATVQIETGDDGSNPGLDCEGACDVDPVLDQPAFAGRRHP